RAEQIRVRLAAQERTDNLLRARSEVDSPLGAAMRSLVLRRCICPDSTARVNVDRAGNDKFAGAASAKQLNLDHRRDLSAHQRLHRRNVALRDGTDRLSLAGICSTSAQSLNRLQAVE